jgi:hypothetical protein
MTTSIPLSDLEASPSAKFDNIGDRAAGRITALTERQQTDTEGRLLTFSDGSPRMLWVITLEQPNGDAVALWAKGGNYKAETGSGESMLKAIGIAVREAGASGVDVGAELVVVHTGLAEKQPGKNAAKLYKAQYRPPAPASVPVDLFSGS